MREDLEEKVAVTLARFDKAVRQSNPVRQKRQEEERHVDLAERIAAEADGGRPPAEKPSCRPWDYEAFTSRLATFTPLNWFSKPPFASPPVCARYGWINTGRDTLFCQCCSAQLRFSAPNNGGIDKDKATGNGAAVVEPVSSSSFSARLKSQHHDLCPWNGNACPKEFLLLPTMAVEDLLTEFAERFNSLVPVITATALPEVSLPSSFEEHCPGGLSALAAKARAVLAQQQRPSGPAAAAGATADATAAAAAVVAGADNTESRSGGTKRQRDGSGGAAGHTDYGKALVFGDEVVGTAAAIATFGWRSAVSTTVAAAPAVPVGAATAGSPTEGSPSSVTAGAGADGGARGAAQAPQRLTCALCKRRLVTDNFLALDVRPTEGAGIRGADAGADPSSPAVDSPERRGGSGRSGKRRRLSGGGTPLKPMDLAVEHRSFCPWASVHPPVEGEGAVEGAVPGWRLSLEALMGWTDPAKQKQLSAKPKEVEGFSDAASGKANEALQKVQKVLGVLMRY